MRTLVVWDFSLHNIDFVWDIIKPIAYDSIGSRDDSYMYLFHYLHWSTAFRHGRVYVDRSVLSCCHVAGLTVMFHSNHGFQHGLQLAYVTRAVQGVGRRIGIVALGPKPMRRFLYPPTMHPVSNGTLPSEVLGLCITKHRLRCGDYFHFLIPTAPFLWNCSLHLPCPSSTWFLSFL